jgi:radical SAM enzyme (TIGR01210 family)
MTEREAIEDAVQSVIDSFNVGSKIVSINPVTVHADTLVDVLFKKRSYSPPWLWSILEVLKRVAPLRPPDAKIICEPVAAGKERGPHNCGGCDHFIEQEIEYYSLHNEFAPSLEHLVCSNGCEKDWRWVIENEGFLCRDVPIFSHHWRKGNSRKGL